MLTRLYSYAFAATHSRRSKVQTIRKHLETLVDLQISANTSLSKFNSSKQLKQLTSSKPPFTAVANSLVEVLYEETATHTHASMGNTPPSTMDSRLNDTEQSLLSHVLENRMVAISEGKPAVARLLVLLDLLAFSFEFGGISLTLARVFLEGCEKLSTISVMPSPTTSESIIRSMIRVFRGISHSHRSTIELLKQSDESAFMEISAKLFALVKEARASIDSENKLDLDIELLHSFIVAKKHLHSLKVDGFLMSDNLLLHKQQSQAAMESIMRETDNSAAAVASSFFEFWMHTNQRGDTATYSSPSEIEENLRRTIVECLHLKNAISSPTSLVLLGQILSKEDLEEVSAGSLICLFNRATQLLLVEQTSGGGEAGNHHGSLHSSPVLAFLESIEGLGVFEEGQKISQKLALYGSAYELLSITSKEGGSERKTEIRSPTATTALQEYGEGLRRVLRVFRVSRVVSLPKLREIERVLSEQRYILQNMNNKAFVEDILGFFACFPFHMEQLTRHSVNHFIAGRFAGMSNSQKLGATLGLLRLEGSDNTDKLVTSPNFATMENISAMMNFIIQMNALAEKTLMERLQLFFIVRTFFAANQIASDPRMLEFCNDARTAFMKAASNATVSAFQTEVLQNLLEQDEKENGRDRRQVTSVEREVLIGDVFAVDFIVNDSIALEVNGPSHYFFVSGVQREDESVSAVSPRVDSDVYIDSVNYSEYLLFETRNSTIKADILSRRKRATDGGGVLKSRSVPLPIYLKYKANHLHKQFVFEACLSNLTLPQITKIL